MKPEKPATQTRGNMQWPLGALQLLQAWQLKPVMKTVDVSNSREVTANSANFSGTSLCVAGSLC